MSRDVELYQASGLDGKPRKPGAPDLVEFPPDVELLAAIYDRLGEQIKMTAAAAGSRRKLRLKPWARPETAADLLRKHRARKNYEHIEAALVYTSTPPPKPPAEADTTVTLTRRPRGPTRPGG